MAQFCRTYRFLTMSRDMSWIKSLMRSFFINLKRLVKKNLRFEYTNTIKDTHLKRIKKINQNNIKNNKFKTIMNSYQNGTFKRFPRTIQTHNQTHIQPYDSKWSNSNCGDPRSEVSSVGSLFRVRSLVQFGVHSKRQFRRWKLWIRLPANRKTKSVFPEVSLLLLPPWNFQKSYAYRFAKAKCTWFFLRSLKFLRFEKNIWKISRICHSEILFLCCEISWKIFV